MKNHKDKKPTATGLTMRFTEQEFTMRFTERERDMLTMALSYGISTMQKNLLTGSNREDRALYAETAHGFHVLKGYICSFGLSDPQWAEASAYEQWQDNHERERFL